MAPHLTVDRVEAGNGEVPGRLGRTHPIGADPVELRSLLRPASIGAGLSGVLPEADKRPGIAGTAYDTAWLAAVPVRPGQRASRFPSSLQWLVDHQSPDGSWGGEVPYEHDRILSTLASLTALASFGRRAVDRASVKSGVRYLWQHGHILASEPVELVGFELLLPALIQGAQGAGVPVPPHLDIYGKERAEKLRLIPPAALYSPRTTAVHSLEFLGDEADLAGLKAAQGVNGSIGNSPAATAFFLARRDDEPALAYLLDCAGRTGDNTVPVLHPCETFELLWAAYHLFLAGVPSAALLTAQEQEVLRSSLQAGGVSLSPTFPIPDADDTAVALLLLHELGESMDPGVLQAFALPDKHFVSFQHERHSSVGVNLHVLHALLRVPGYPDRDATVVRLVDYLAEQQIRGLYWFDKWHISPYYATAHAIAVLGELPPHLAPRAAPLIQRSLDWLRQTQNGDGSWGFYGQPTAEETAYALLGLTAGSQAHVSFTRSEIERVKDVYERDRQRCARAERYLRKLLGPGNWDTERKLPPLWIDKCLYTPTMVVRSAIQAARIAYRRAERTRDLGCCGRNRRPGMGSMAS
ncbi:MAG: hypothetical protein HY675_02765 [Chloroflexi bacterium]|nr:hypothetical protein [Chloroflexota bacterium]